MNKIVIMGRLTASPELKYTKTDTAVVSFQVAVNREYKADQTDFVPCVAWRKTAEFIDKHFDKGDMIAIVGSLQSRQWEDDNGKKHTAWEVIVANTYFCGGKKKDTKAVDVSADDDADGSIFTEMTDTDDGDLPF